jgi:hypothetical protein
MQWHRYVYHCPYHRPNCHADDGPDCSTKPHADCAYCRPDDGPEYGTECRANRFSFCNAECSAEC